MESIKSDLAALGFKFDKITYSSDSFEKMEKYAEQLLKVRDANIPLVNRFAGRKGLHRYRNEGSDQKLAR